MTRFSAVLRTNVPSIQCPEDFLRNTSDFLCQRLKADSKNVVLELHTGVTMWRGGSLDRALNVDIRHNDDNINKASKVDLAEDIANFMAKQIQIPKDRTLVLFFDSRKCT